MYDMLPLFSQYTQNTKNYICISIPNYKLHIKYRIEYAEETFTRVFFFSIFFCKSRIQYKKIIFGSRIVTEMAEPTNNRQTMYKTVHH